MKSASKIISFSILFGLLVSLASAQTNTPTNTPTATPTNTPTPTNTATALVYTPVAGARPTTIVGFNSLLYDGGMIGNGNLMIRGKLVVPPRQDGGNAGARNVASGGFQLYPVSIPTMTNGTTESTIYTTSSPTPSPTWAAIDSDVSVAIDGTNYRVGANSLKLTFVSGFDDQDGATSVITSDSWESDKSFFAWVRSSVDLASCEMQLMTFDDTANAKFCFPAIPRNKWVQVELDIQPLAGGTGDAITRIGFVASSTAVTNHPNGFVFNVTQTLKSAAADENAGTPAFTSIAQDTSPACWKSNTPGTVVENVDYYVAHRNGSDVLITLTNQSANSWQCLYSKE